MQAAAPPPPPPEAAMAAAVDDKALGALTKQVRSRALSCAAVGALPRGMLFTGYSATI